VLFGGNVFSETERWRMRQLVARFGKAVKGVLTGSAIQTVGRGQAAFSGWRSGGGAERGTGRG
jgi:hypothetical protein